MGRFYPLYVRRSDGKAELVSKGSRKKELNQPTDDQLDQRPDKMGISDFYREVAPEEPKHLDWRRKIGGMLARELDWKEKAGDNGYILATFPQNYRLYEHVKKTVVNGKTEVKSKTHGAGGNDRQDAYLYGHPLGRRKRFRSPGDFFAHVYWLSTDESGDPDNCTCKICSPEDLENIIPNTTMSVNRNQAANFKPAAGQTVTAATRPTSAQSMKMKPEPTPSTAMPTSRPPSTSTPTQPPRGPTPLPQSRSQEAFTDSHYRAFMYRPGELIWFQRGQAWGLGLILRRWSTSPSTSDKNYLVQPLSHPPLPSQPNYPQQVIKSSELEMRPWIAWSVPKFTNDGLNNLSPPAQYESVDWQAVKERRFGSGDLEVDGSILAAKMVDSSYTPFNKLRVEQPQQGVTETFYEGLFLGAEKVWVGEPVRLHIGSGTDIMVVHSIIERSASSSPEGPTMQLQGDVYTLSQIPHSNPNIPSPASPSNNPHLPVRLTEDLAYRNNCSIRIKRTASFWKLTNPQVRVNLNDIKGRWYEASLILPILHPQQAAEAERVGEIQEASLWMNSRGDCVNSNRPPGSQKLPRLNVRCEGRREAFGKSIPKQVVIVEGREPPTTTTGSEEGKGGQEDMVIDPRFETADGSVDEGKGSFDELMNLDGMEGGFGQEFGSHHDPNHEGFF